MKPVHALIFLVVLMIHSWVEAKCQAEQIRTLEELHQRYPERIDSLFQSLDLNRMGLEKVRSAVEKGNAVLACQELLAYYRDGKSARFLRKEQPLFSSKKDPAADSIVANIFTFYYLPDKVEFLPSGHLDWSHQGPDNDIEWAWGLNRHYHILTLLDSYFQTGNPLYAKTVDWHLHDWVVSSLPYPRVKSVTAFWRGLEVSFRVKVWARVFFGLIGSEHLTPVTRILLLTSFSEHAHYLQNFHAKEGNWLTMEMSGLARGATAWPEFKEASEWIAYAKERMEEGLKEQVYPDGVQKELTSHYHQVALNNFTLFKDICEEANEPLSEGYKRMLEKMQAYIAKTMRPTGYGVLNNDSDRRFNREEVIQAASTHNREDWLFIASNGEKGKRPDGVPSFIFPWAGQLVMRGGYDRGAHWSFFDIGPWGTGHQHNDKLHISVSAYGRDLLVDGGRFAYRGALAEKFRTYARGSASHNVVLIDGKGQDSGPRVAAERIGDNHFKITERFDYAWSSFDRFKEVQGIGKHTRSLFYVRGKFWIVVDQIDTDRPRKIQTLWHWHPGSKVGVQESHVVSTDHEHGNLSIIPLGDNGWDVSLVKGQEQPVPQGWYSERYNKAEPAVAAIYSTEIKSSSRFVWVLFPSETKGSSVQAEILSWNKDGVVVRVKDERSNLWEVMVPFSDSEKAEYKFISSNERLIQPNGEHSPDEISKLLSRMDLNAPGLDDVKRYATDPVNAAKALLAYYRSRSSVRHPVDRNERAAARGHYATEKDLRVADDALKHIFIGQSAYPPYYCGDDIDWGLRPVPDNEWVWQLNRMGFWEAMGKAYWHTGDEKYAREFCLQLLDWTQKNPRDEQHAYAWRSIEAGIRGHLWMNHFQRFLDAPSFTPEVLVAFLNSCYDHGSYLMTKYRKGSNWGLMEAEGMAFIAMIFPEFHESKKWLNESISRLNREIDSQVYPDGHQRELAMGYHTSSVGWFKRTLDLATMNGRADAFPPSYLDRIEKMCEIPYKLGFPDGTTTQFGDSWTGSVGHLWPNLREWAKVFDRDDFLYVASEGKEGKKPTQTAFALGHSGFYSMRDGWGKEAITFVLKCGPDGGGHCQPDNGTFELYAGKRHLMPDAGSYIYSGDPENRAWFRQTKVHQTLTLNEANTAYAPRQLVWKPGKILDVLVVENAGYTDLTHRRAVFFVDKKFFVIVDEAIGNGVGNVDLHFQLAPGEAIFDSTRFSVRTDFKEGWNVSVQAMDQTGMKLQEEEGWVSFVYTKKEPRPAFRYRLRKNANENIRFVTVVVPYAGVTPPNIDARIIGNPEIGGSKLELRVTADGDSRRIGYKIVD